MVPRLSTASRRRRAAIDLAELKPVHHLQTLGDDTPNAWQSSGLHPAFEIEGPFCAGWWRFRVKLRRLDNQHAERVNADFQADTGEGYQAGPPLERIVWNSELDEGHIYFRLQRPAESLRFQPLSGPGTFQIDAFAGRRLSRVGSLFTAMNNKLKLLRDYNCTGRVIGRGLRMLLAGRFVEVWRKLFQALPDTRRYNPESDAYVRMVAGLGRSRVPRSRSERQGLLDAYGELPGRPTVSLVLPVVGESAHTTMLTIRSVLMQVYEEWELHLVVGSDASPDVIKLVEYQAEQQERIHLAFAEPGESIDDAAAGALDRIEGELVAFLQPSFELDEACLLRLMQAGLAVPGFGMILNQVPPPAEAGGRTAVSGNAFRPGTAGQQTNIYRTADVRALAKLPPVAGTGLPAGTELARLLPAEREAVYHHDVLAYPISCLTTIPGGIDEFVDIENPPRALLLTGNICGLSGWDNVVFEIARGLHSLGANVRLNAASHHQADLLPPALLPARRLRREGDLELLIAPPHLLEHHPHPPGCVVFTMWESDRLEKKWVDDLNQATLVIVPSQWAVESFRASGVTAPIEVVPLGHDSLTFHRTNAWPDVCTFGIAASLMGGGVRKNVGRVVDAFRRAFPDEPDVRLRVKLTPKCEIDEPNDPRIEVLRRFLLPGELAEWYRTLTAYVNASAAEGFGLHLVEAMACGRPVVSPAYSAVTEYFDEGVGFGVAYTLTEAEGTIYQGSWADLNDDHLVETLRRIYEDSAEVRTRGERAAARTRRFTWKETGRQLVEVLERHAGDRLTA